MKTRISDRLIGHLTSAPVLISLGLLLINDWYLKAAYGNWLTGKLSDFAGIMLLSLLVFAAFPRGRAFSAIGVCAVFAWWKSPLSQPAIDAINSFGLPPVGRVVDYTDLMALVMVPAAWFAVVRRERYWRPMRPLRRALAPPMAAACMAAMIATSPARYCEVFEIREMGKPAELDRETVAGKLRSVFDELEMRCHECAAPQEQGEFSGGSTIISYVFLDDGRIRFHADSVHQGGPFPGAPGTSVREFRKKLRSALEGISGDFESHEYSDHHSNYRPSRDAIHAKYVPELFDEVAKNNGLSGQSPGEYKQETFNGGLRFRFTDDVTLEYSAWGGIATIVRPEIDEALNGRFAGLQFYQFDEDSTFVDFENAELRPPQEAP